MGRNGGGRICKNNLHLRIPYLHPSQLYFAKTRTAGRRRRPAAAAKNKHRPRVGSKAYQVGDLELCVFGFNFAEGCTCIVKDEINKVMAKKHPNEVQSSNFSIGAASVNIHGTMYVPAFSICGISSSGQFFLHRTSSEG